MLKYAEIPRGARHVCNSLSNDPEKQKPHTILAGDKASMAKWKGLLNPSWWLSTAEFFRFSCTLKTFLIKTWGRKVLALQFKELCDPEQSP